ncbi:MAG TPA: type I methionyl aminopeptidase, partial [Anaeromyxobacteraceae bacterium]|nr:type I methionyl aminopeptidase [Anaeromyxobacteraceae bacterium]
VAKVLAAMRAAVRAGVTTAELDAVASGVMAAHGARSAPQHDYGFPGATCISVNDDAVHGVPGPRPLAKGDLVSLDVVVELDGYYADAAITVGVPPVAPEAQRLVAAAEAAFRRAAAVARAGVPLSRVGAAVEAEVERRGFKVLRDLCGHGVGRAIHEDPPVLNHYDPDARRPLTEGLVVAIEPIIAAGTRHVRDRNDGWTIASADGSLTAHHEHTMVITRGRPLLVTAEA